MPVMFFKMIGTAQYKQTTCQKILAGSICEVAVTIFGTVKLFITDLLHFLCFWDRTNKVKTDVPYSCFK